MIPKKIHYCWFGRGPLPVLAVKCIESWKKYFPNYEVIEWNEENFDVNIIPYTKEAYNAKKYAFVSDYARFWILYNHGGVYFDVDVEVIKPMFHIIERGPFMGFENNGRGLDSTSLDSLLGVAAGLGLAAEANMKLYKDILDYYSSEHFLNNDGTLNLRTIVSRVTEVLMLKGLIQKNIEQEVDGVIIYPHDYFCPIRITDGKKTITKNTVSIHHYAASWTTPSHRFFRKLILFIGGAKLKTFLSRILRKLK